TDQPGGGRRAEPHARGTVGGGPHADARPDRGRAASGAGSAHDTTDRSADAHGEVPARGGEGPSMSAMAMETIVSLCKRRGFIFQSSEIYGGTRSCSDYCPLRAAHTNTPQPLS